MVAHRQSLACRGCHTLHEDIRLLVAVDIGIDGSGIDGSLKITFCICLLPSETVVTVIRRHTLRVDIEHTAQ